ncbi:WD repeat and FYVE domain-containing protein 1 isoform X3 [Channa argus]
MAAEIHSRPQTARPVLLNKIEGHSDAVNVAVLIPKEDGVITVSEDRTIRVWLKRDSGQYWPSIYHTVSSPCSCMSYHHDSRRIFIGQDNGAVVEFLISEDFNKMNHVKTYPAHQNRVSDMVFSLESEWVVSTGHDKSVSWMCTQSGSMLGRHYFTAWASCLQYDHETQHAFVGDYSGQITLLKLEKQTYSTITTLKGHEGSVGALWWDPIQRLLFSGASDHSVIMWDIGGRKGRTLLLQGHHERVQALRYLQLTRQLVSCSADGGIAVWNMDTQREEYLSSSIGLDGEHQCKVNFSSLQRCLIGFKSGLWLGHSRTFTELSCSHFFVISVVWLGSLSCSQMKHRPSLRSRALWNRLFTRLSLYIAAFVFHSIVTSLPVPAAEKHPHSMILPTPGFTLGMVLAR